MFDALVHQEYFDFTSIPFFFNRVRGNDITKIGSVVSGLVERLTAAGVVIHVNNTGYMKGIIPDEHLADNQGALFCPS